MINMNKKTGVITTIIVVVLCSLIGRFAGHLVGKSMGENMSKSRQMREIDKFMENTAEYESGKVSGVLQKGYILNNKVIRPSMVKVAN